MVKKESTALEVLLTQQILSFEHYIEINLPRAVNFQSDALRCLVPFVQVKNMKNTQRGVLLLAE